MFYFDYPSEAIMFEELWEKYINDAYTCYPSPGIPSIEGIIEDEGLAEELCESASIAVFGVPFGDLEINPYEWDSYTEDSPEMEDFFETKDDYENQVICDLMYMVNRFNMSFQHFDEEFMNVPIVRVW